jgi:crotonobetainyl-CoA:carnitine CoA-transferase CaiB-like acyl-CoA transferase
VSTHWKIFARNKKSLCLELRKPEARELLMSCCRPRRCSSRAFARARWKRWISARKNC